MSEPARIRTSGKRTNMYLSSVGDFARFERVAAFHRDRFPLLHSFHRLDGLVWTIPTPTLDSRLFLPSGVEVAGIEARIRLLGVAA